jgi:hypothetical protein
MANQKKKLGIIGFIMGALVLLPRPAQAFKLPGPLNTLLDTVTGGVGLGIAERINGYLSLGLGRLDKILGIDPGSVSGALGVVDPLKAAQAIDEKQLKAIQDDLGITSTVQGTLEKGKFNTELGLAIGSSIFSTETQSVLKEVGDINQKLTEGSGELAQKAQSENVTQNIAKIQTQQNAQQIGVLNAISQTENLQLQQQAATNVSSAVTADHANNEEQRIAQQTADEVRYTTQQSGMAQGVIEGIGK